MARTVEHILRDKLGSLMIQAAAFEAENEALHEQVDSLKQIIEQKENEQEKAPE